MKGKREQVKKKRANKEKESKYEATDGGGVVSE